MNPDRVIQSEVDAVLTQMEGSYATFLRDWSIKQYANAYAHKDAWPAWVFIDEINKARLAMIEAVHGGASKDAIEAEFTRVREDYLACHSYGTRTREEEDAEQIAPVLPGNIWKGFGYALLFTTGATLLFWGVWHIIPWREIWTRF